MPVQDVRERLSTSCTKDLIGRSSESFTGSKEVAVEEVVLLVYVGVVFTFSN